MHRRTILSGLLMSLVAVLMPRISSTPSLPVLHGDGVHDDTDAIQALINGERVIDAKTGMPWKSRSVEDRHFRTSRTIRLSDISQIEMIRNCHFTTTADYCFWGPA